MKNCWVIAAAFGVGLATFMPSAQALEPYEQAMKSDLAKEALLLDVVTVGSNTIAVGEYGHVIISPDNGATWNQATDVPTRNTLTSVSFYDEKNGLAVGHDMTILRTEDGGNSWELTYNDREIELPLLAVYYVNKNYALAFGAFSQVLESNDGGKSWESRALSDDAEDDFHLNDAFKGASGDIFVPAEFGNVYRSQDGGKSFEALTTPYDGSFWGGMSLSNGDLLVWGMRGNAFVSSDNGESWRKVVTNTDRSISGGTQLSDGHIVLAGLSGLVLESVDGGKTFTEFVRPDRLSFAQVSPGPDLKNVILFGDSGVRMHALGK